MRLRARLSIAAAVALVLGLALARSIVGYVTPFILALFLAAVIDPLVDRLEKRGVPRAFGALAVIGALGAAVLGTAWVLIANVLREAEALRGELPHYAAQLRGYVEGWSSAAEGLLMELPHPFDEALLRGVQSLSEAAGEAATDLVGRAGTLPGLFFVGFVALIATYFLSRDKRTLGDFFIRLFPPSWRPEMRRLKGEIAGGLLGFVRAQAILVSLSAGISVGGLLLFDYPYAWLLGILAGILDLVPMVGPSGVFIPLIVAGAATGAWNRTFGIACVWLTVLLVRQIVEPDVVGRHVGLHPLTTLVAAYLGGAWLGVHGLVLGPIVAITVKAICVISVLPHLHRED